MRATVGISFLVAAYLAGCVARRYEHPAPEEPHAVLKLRVHYHDAPGPQLGETVTLDDLALHTPPAHGGEGRRYHRAYRIRPAPQRLAVSSSFFHLVREQRREQYTEYERYQCGTRTNAFGATEPKYCERPVTKWRTVYDTRRVNDGTCRRSGFLQARTGAVYVLQYDFYGHEQCSLRCFEQRADPGGAFQLVPCERAAPAQSGQPSP